MGFVSQSAVIANSRASAASVRDTRGFWVPVGADVVRMDHDPWGKPVGALLEQQRTNYCTESNRLSMWGQGYVTTADAAAVGIDGLVSASRITATSGNLANFTGVSKVFTSPSPGAVHLLSAFVKTLGIPACNIALADSAASYVPGFGTTLNFSTGARANFTTGSGTAVVASGTEPYPDGWTRIWVVGTIGSATALATSVYAQPTSGTAGQQMLVGHIQCEIVNGPAQTPSSPIFTYGAAGTRASDICEVPIGAWINQSAGTFIVDYESASVNDMMFGVCGVGGFNNSFYYLGAQGQVIKDGYAAGGGMAGTWAAGRNKIAAAYDSGGWRLSRNGQAVQSTSLILNQAIAHVSMGAAPWDRLPQSGGGRVRRWRYLPRRASDAEIQSLSSS